MDAVVTIVRNSKLRIIQSEVSGVAQLHIHSHIPLWGFGPWNRSLPTDIIGLDSWKINVYVDI